MKKLKFAAAAGFAAVLFWGNVIPAARWMTTAMPAAVCDEPFRSSGLTICEAASANPYIDESIRPIQLNVHTHNMVDEDGMGQLLRSSVTQVAFVGSAAADGLEALQNALWQYNNEKERNSRSAREGLSLQAEKDRAERRASGSDFFSAYEDLNDVFVRRADTLAVSLLEYSRSYEGGVHGMYGVLGRNFDSQTGQELTLGDVFTDMGELAVAIGAQLRRDYPKASFMESGGVGMMEMVDQLVKNGSIIWTLDPCGASFYFNPYLLGSYAEGIFTATILFDEHPRLFAEKYRRSPRSFCMELAPYLPIRTSFADGSGRALNVTTTDGGVRIIMGGKIFDDWGETYDMRPVLVSLADGRRYLYVDGIGAGDAWERTRVYDINGDAPFRVTAKQQFTRRADVDEDFIEAERGPIIIDENRDKGFFIMADPEDFYMTRLNKATGKAELCWCRVGADGTPEVILASGQNSK